MQGQDTKGIRWAMVIVAAGLLSGACREASRQPAPSVGPVTKKLVVLSPHAPVIRDTFAPRFSQWHEEKYGQPVSVQWINKGTTECYRSILNQYAGMTEGYAVDVFWGGGVAIHQDLANRGYTQPIKLPAATVAVIPKELNGQRLYAEDASWFGTALSGMGILYNRAACQTRGLPVPQTWADLAAPAYRYWVAAADPSRSGSTTQCLVLVLLKNGWQEGWGVLMGILANTSGLLPASSMIGPNVTAGVAVAGLEPEFVARMAIADAPGTLDYINPPSATVITPDPITKLIRAPHPEVADQFVEFILSVEGQALWALGPDENHPDSKPLFHYPIRPDVYQQYGDKLLVKGSPFSAPSDFKIDRLALEAYTKLLPSLVNAACGPNHLLLQKAWYAALAKGENSPALASLKAPLFDQEAALRYAAECGGDEKRAAELQAEWAKQFRERYDKVIAPATAPH